MTDQHPITPPPELVQQWINEAAGGHDPRWQDYEQDIATRAAQWGANTELTECCKCIYDQGWFTDPSLRIAQLRAARRPKPQTLASIALHMLDTIERDAHYLPEITDTIRRALEALPDDQH